MLFFSEPKAVVWICDFLSHEDLFRLEGVSKQCQQILQDSSSSIYTNLDLAGKRGCNLLLKEFAADERFQTGVTRLSTEFCNRLTDDTLKVLDKFHSLTSLNLNGCPLLTDDAVISAMTRCPNLTRLSLYWDPSLSDKSLQAIASSQCASKLVHLNLSGMRHATDVGMVAVAEACPNLTHLDMTRMETLRDDSLIAVAKNCPQLRYLNLYACAHFLDPGVVAIAQGCPLLEFVDLCGTHSVTDVSIQALASGCPRITSLNLTWVTKIGDASLEAIGEHLRALCFLSVHGNRRMSDEGVRHIAKGCPKLEVLDVNGTPISKDLVREIMPELKELVAL